MLQLYFKVKFLLDNQFCVHYIVQGNLNKDISYFLKKASHLKS